MQLMKGRSTNKDAESAVQEATAAFETTPEILFVFSSTTQNAADVTSAIAKRFPGVPVAGCTTAGEQLGAVHANGSLVVMGVADSEVAWSVRQVQNLEAQDSESLTATTAAMFDEVDLAPEEVDPNQAVCMLFIDGLRGLEERICSDLADALEGIPLAGGSAGDDLKFEETRVFGPDGALTNAATLVVARSTDGTPIRVLKHQHFTSTPTSLVVTRVEGRTVHEFDGYPATEAYAAALGVKPEELSSDLSFLNPVTFACNGEIYVRSVQAIHDDGSITFYCAVEEGMVLELGGHKDMCEALDQDLHTGFADKPELVVGFNCILRALEASGKELHESLGEIYDSEIPGLVGFDTYGEQLNGLHINQTLVAVGFGRAAD
ncbi:MAG: FIST signal transduction protein [Planctomycetota bacterium]